MAPKELLGKRLKREYDQELSTTLDPKARSELKANKNLAVAFLIIGILTILVLILNAAHVFYLDMTLVGILCGIIAFLCFGSSFTIIFTSRTKQNRNQIIKYTLLTNLILICTALDCTLTFHAPVMMVIPIAIAVWYFDKKTMIYTVVACVLLMITTSFLWPITQAQADLNLFNANSTHSLDYGLAEYVINRTPVDYWRYMGNLLQDSLLPRMIIYALVCVICVITAILGKKMVDEQIDIANKHARIDGELNLATTIQANMLPKIFPAFPKLKEIDLYAEMYPAKEVGGDLYDFFMIDDKHIAIVIADVSGKGVPAALFMAITKTLLKNTLMEHNVSETMSIVNNSLCDGNVAELFVTGWIGVIDLNTLTLHFANAGHNPPIVKLSNKVSFLKEKSGIPLGVFENVEYIEHSIKMSAGDKILLYTDGVTEATSKEGELFGENRLLNFLEEHKKENNEELLKNLKIALDEFANGTEQFDDITALALTLKK